MTVCVRRISKKILLLLQWLLLKYSVTITDIDRLSQTNLLTGERPCIKTINWEKKTLAEEIFNQFN